MHYLKTLLKHILYNDFTDKEFSRFMKIRAITCQIGKIPSDKQIASVCPKKTYESIVKALAKEGQSIDKVLAKDIEDASEVQDIRTYWKEKKRQQRGKQTSVQETVKDMSTQHIRLDKSILDKNIKDTKLAPQAVFIEKFSKLYTHETKEKYKTDKKDFILVAGLIKKYGIKLVEDKAKTLFTLCKTKSKWFTKGGMGDFTIAKLNSQWNGIIKEKSVAESWLERG